MPADRLHAESRVSMGLRKCAENMISTTTRRRTDVTILRSFALLLGNRWRQVPFIDPGLNPIGANLFCYNIFGPGFCGAWKIPKGRTPAVANRRSPLPDSIQAPPRVGFDGE